MLPAYPANVLCFSLESSLIRCCMKTLMGHTGPNSILLEVDTMLPAYTAYVLCFSLKILFDQVLHEDTDGSHRPQFHPVGG